MKKIILIIIIVLSIFIISCNENQEEVVAPLSNEVIISEVEPIKLKIAPYVKGIKYHSSAVDDWELYLNNAFNIEIDMISMESFTNTSNYNYATETLKDVWPGLLVRSSNYLQSQGFAIERYIEEASILPLNEFVIESKLFESLPDEIKYAYMDSNGNIWALPLDDDLYLIGREIRKDWMENEDITEPNTLEDLYEMMYHFTYNDPNHSGENDTYGDFISYDAAFTNIIHFKDVFEANGCYLTYEKHSMENPARISYQGNRVYPVGLNPDSGLIENTAYNPNMIETLNYIGALIDSNVIDFLHSKDEDKFYNKSMYQNTYGCHLDVIDQNECDKERFSYVFALTGLKNKLTSSVLSGGLNAYLLTSSADVEQAKLYIPKLIDTFYGTKDGYVFGNYGITGNDYNYTYEKGILSKNDTYEENQTQVQLVGNLSWYEKQINNNVSNNVLTREEIFEDQRIYALSPRMMISQSIVYDVIEGQNTHLLSNLLAIKCMKAFTTFVDGDISSEEFVEKIQQFSELHGLDEKIEEMNEKWLGENR